MRQFIEHKNTDTSPKGTIYVYYDLNWPGNS